MNVTLNFILVDEAESLVSGVEMSETSSVTQSIDYDLDSMDGCSWVTEPPNMIEFDQRQPLGSKQCESQLRYDVLKFRSRYFIDEFLRDEFREKIKFFLY